VHDPFSSIFIIIITIHFIRRLPPLIRLRLLTSHCERSVYAYSSYDLYEDTPPEIISFFFSYDGDTCTVEHAAAAAQHKKDNNNK
jgi:hypothetical protein